MKAEYLRHEYTWSNHCITGNVLGWGMTASSCPKDRDMLRELEKTASAARPERTAGIPVEELSYSPVCGFVKMIVIPCDSGEDKRKNKKVFLYQSKDKAAGPGVYTAPEGIWEDVPKEGYLPPVEMEARTGQPEDIFMEMQVYDRLPDFLRAVFWCLFEKKEGLNFVAPSWRKEEFAQKAGKLMYAIHSILPPHLRKKAGYVSYTEQAVSREPFYFSAEPCVDSYINLDSFETQEFAPPATGLEEYFFYHLSELLVKRDGRYDRFWSETEPYLAASTGGNEERKLFWLFYRFCQKNGMETLAKRELLPGMPELFYWASGEPALQETAKEVRRQLHKETFTPEEKEEYLRILLEGFTRRAEEPVCGELDWLLGEWYVTEREVFQEQLLIIREKYPVVYALLLGRHTDREGAWQREIFVEHSKDFERLEGYVAVLEKTEIPAELKDRIILAGIHLLNQDLFQKENYAQFDALMLRLSRKDQWVEILKDFVTGQLDPEAENLDDSQLETACYVERLLKKYAPKEATGILAKEKRRRRKTELPIAAAGVEAFGADAAEREAEDIRILKAETLKDALLLGYPQGFLTGCALYLCNYSLLIGHWKIAIGMAGMWLLLMMNYYYLLTYREPRFPFWKNVGLCILEGYAIELVASLLLPQKVRVIYFIVLGVAALVAQAYHIYRRRMEEEDE